MTSPVDFRDFLYQELESRKKSTPGYSLRKFAKFLAVDASFLTKLIHKKRNLTVPVINRLGKKLSLNDDELQNFKMLLFRSIDRPSYFREGKTKTKFNKILAAKAKSILEWHFFTVLELLSIEDFDATAKSLALVLKTSEDFVSATLSQLESLGLIEKDECGRYKLIEVNNSVAPKTSTSEEMKRLQIQLHLKSISAIETVPLEKRDHTGIFLAIPSGRVEEAKKLIKNFRRRFMTTMQRPGKRDCVYYLGNYFFPLCEIDKK